MNDLESLRNHSDLIDYQEGLDWLEGILEKYLKNYPTPDLYPIGECRIVVKLYKEDRDLLTVVNVKNKEIEHYYKGMLSDGKKK